MRVEVIEKTINRGLMMACKLFPAEIAEILTKRIKKKVV
jgi:hypothetical protein